MKKFWKSSLELMGLCKSHNSGQNAVLFLYRMVDSPIYQREMVHVIYSLMCVCIFSTALYIILTKRTRMWTLDYKIIGIMQPIMLHLDFKRETFCTVFLVLESIF